MKKKLDESATHPEPHNNKNASKLNQLRASVLGANDGIVSVAGIVAGVAGATSSKGIIVAAGLAGIVAGALSMAAGEYVSVSSQRDTERALLKKEHQELIDYPDEEFEELAGIYEKKGLSSITARQVAKELTEKDAYAAHIDAELNIDPDDLNNPWQAAIASAISFLIGASIPLVAVLIPPQNERIYVVFIAVVLALILTGILSAIAGGANKFKATLRVVIGGCIAMVVTYTIGKFVGIGNF